MNNVKHFGAIADGKSHPLSELFPTLEEAWAVYPLAESLQDEIDLCAIQKCIEITKTDGAIRRFTNLRSDNGGLVLLPPGVYKINRPIVIPRSSNVPGYSIKFEGINEVSCIIEGTNSFPSGRALIEWEQILLRTYSQSIRNLTFSPPNVEGVKCIYYKLMDRSSAETMFKEHMTYPTIENIVCEGNNGFHDVSIDFEGLIRSGTFKNIKSNYTRGSEKYSTILIRAEKSMSEGYGSGSVFYENAGIGFSTFERIDGGSIRGGWCTVFEGRLMNCDWLMGMAGNGALPSNNVPSFNFVNCGNVSLKRFYTEGRAERPQIRFENCEFVELNGLWLGFGDYKDNPSNGIEFINSKDCTVKNRAKHPRAPSFGEYGGKVIIMDGNSKRNKILNFQIKGSFNREIIDMGTDNYFDLMDVSNDQRIVVGRT